MEPQRQVSGTKVWNWRLQTFDVWNQKLKKSNLVLDLVTLIIINGQKHICYIFYRVGPYIEVLVLVMPNCHQRELSPVKLKRWPVLRKQDLFKKCDLNFASLLEKFCECIANVFSAMGSLSLKLERLRILEKLLLEKFFWK